MARASRDVEFPLPPLDTQRKIAAILSAYDDLIENNNRRIKLLEEMAQRIYREWFVDFRYPGHENVRLVDSELGPIPRGLGGPDTRDDAGVALPAIAARHRLKATSAVSVIRSECIWLPTDLSMAIAMRTCDESAEDAASSSGSQRRVCAVTCRAPSGRLLGSESQTA